MRCKCKNHSRKFCIILDIKFLKNILSSVIIKHYRFINSYNWQIKILRYKVTMKVKDFFWTCKMFNFASVNIKFKHRISSVSQVQLLLYSSHLACNLKPRLHIRPTAPRHKYEVFILCYELCYSYQLCGVSV